MSTTARLLRRDGHWTLEIQELVPVDRDVYRTAKRHVHGAPSIAAHVRRSSTEPALRDATLTLLKVRSDEDCTYEWTAGEWVLAEGQGSGDAERLDASALQATLKELGAELLILRASYSALKERVGRAERRAREEWVSEPPVASDSLDEETSSPSGSASRDESDETDESDERPPSMPPDDARDVDAPPAKPAHPLMMPPKAAILATIKQLTAGELELEHAIQEPPVNVLEGLYWSSLVEEDGSESGAILANARAVVELGAALLGQTGAVLEQQLAAGEPSEDALAAMTEICNALAGAFGAASARAIRAGALARGGPGPQPWLASCEKSVVFSTRRGGELWLVTR